MDVFCSLVQEMKGVGCWRRESRPPLWQFPLLRRDQLLFHAASGGSCVPVITQVIKEGRESLWGQTVHLETWPRITIRDSHVAEPSVQVMETQDTSLFKKTGFIDVAILGYESELDMEKHVKSIPAE